MARPGSLPGARLLVGFATGSSLAWLTCADVVLLLTPTGSLPSARWRWWAWVPAVAPLAPLQRGVVEPSPLSPDYEGNPLVVPALARVLAVPSAIATAVVLLGLLLAAWSLAGRFRRARGNERLQLRWLALAGGVAAVLLLVAIVAAALAKDTVVFASLMIGVTLLPLSTGAAILRYRLYDLDRIISRTVAYALLTVLLGLGYTGVILGLGQLAPHRSSLGVAVATLAVAARRRSWWQRMMGRLPEGAGSPLTSAQERAGAHVETHSAWLHNSVRGAIALALAVLVAKLTGVHNSFWVVLGTLAVLRSNALSTGQNALRGLLGTVAGFVMDGVIVYAVGTDTTVPWVLLPPAVAFAGLAPAAISFAVGQAAFTTTLLILYNIIGSVGWQIGLVRIEDVAIGGAVSLVVGALFWPRGGASALGKALAEGFPDSARYQRSAVEYGVTRCDAQMASAAEPGDDRRRAAAAARRLDDAFRQFLAERGTKHIPMADVTSLLTGSRCCGSPPTRSSTCGAMGTGPGPATGPRTSADRTRTAALPPEGRGQAVWLQMTQSCQRSRSGSSLSHARQWRGRRPSIR